MSTAFTSGYSSHLVPNNQGYQILPPVSFTPNGQYASSSSGMSASNWQTGFHSESQIAVEPNANSKPLVNSKRTPEEIEYMEQTEKRVSAKLKEDLEKVLHPDVDSPFVDEMDVINRLLPYHVFQQPKEDLSAIVAGKGKEKAAGIDWDDEIAVSKLSLECLKRREAIRERWRKLKIRCGQRPAPDSQSYYLAQVILDADRSENAWLSNELRTARAEVERIEREKRAANSTSNMARMSHFSVAPQPVMPSTAQTQYYRGYPYAYTQAYGTIAPTPAPTVSSFPISTTPSTTSAASTTNYTPYQSTSAIPVQLPVASLPALHALGITPVPATSLPPEGQPQPPAVLRGSTANGTILSLEINVSLLQSTQMSGLAMILNSLVTRNNATAGTTVNATSIPNSSASSTS